jgi:hypothetical protein
MVVVKVIMMKVMVTTTIGDDSKGRKIIKLARS